MNDIIEENSKSEITEKRLRGRPEIDNPCQAGKPNAGKKYFKQYYETKLKNCLINRPECNSMTEKSNLRNHIKSSLCTKIANHLMTS